MRRKIMVVGAGKSGKTSLVNILNDYDGPLRKTQDMIFGKYTIDVPGAYLENPWMYKHLISAAQNNAGHVLILVDQSDVTEIYSPGFAKVFRCPVTGVITKADVHPENREICEKQLKAIGVDPPYFPVSLTERTGIDELKDHLREFMIEKDEDR